MRREALRWGIALIALALGHAAAMADTNDVLQGPSASSCPVTDYFRDWFKRVAKTQAEQPHWASPVFTVSPFLQELVRYDIYSQSVAGGHTLNSYGAGKGLEFIPSERIQFVVGLPAYQTQNTTPHRNGWADQNFMMKYRLLAANEQEGNYVLTTFMGLAVPDGSDDYTTHHFIFTPSIAGGKGWGDFDLQGTAGVAIPDNDGGRHTIGENVAVNLTAQYHVAKYFWPEVEANYNYWPNGIHEGLNQLCITPGLVLGRFPISGRVAAFVGVGCQIAVTDHPLIHRNFILTTRLPF